MGRTKQPESLHVRQAYEVYLSQPSPRSIKKLAVQIGKPVRTVFDWQRRYGWHARAIAHDEKLIAAAQAEKDEEQATRSVMHNFYQSLKYTLGQYVATVKKRQETGAPVDERQAHTALRCLELLHKDYAEILSEPDDA